jgi:hypothetical protein
MGSATCRTDKQSALALEKDAPFHRTMSASAPSHHDLFLAVFITNIAESEFSAHTGAFAGLHCPE